MRDLPAPRDRSGKLRIGLLLWLAILAAVGYVGLEIGGVYWRRFRLEEHVKQQLAYAGQLTNEAIRQRVLSDVASMRLPPEARNVHVVETERPRALQVSIAYVETANLLFTSRRFPVSIRLRRTF